LAQDAPLTNDDVVKMVQAKLSPSVIVSTIQSAGSVTFDLSPTALVALKNAGVDDRVIEAMLASGRARRDGPAPNPATFGGPDKSDVLSTSREPEFILRNFKTMFVDASQASFVDSNQMRAALRRNRDFEQLRITIVEDIAVADVVLEVGYTFPRTYPFSLKHQNTSVVLVSSQGSGSFLRGRGANGVAEELSKLLKPYRVGSPSAGTRK
jgi:hypothetical protein